MRFGIEQITNFILMILHYIWIIVICKITILLNIPQVKTENNI